MNIQKISSVKHLSVLVTMAMMTILYGCNPTTDEEILIEQIQYELEDGQFIAVKLDPNLVQDGHVFTSLEKFEEALEQMEEAGHPISLNKALYEKLSHYFPTFEISLMDHNSQVEIGGVLYRADNEAAYALSEDGKWEKTIHYGTDGLTDLHETTKVYENLGQLHLLEDYEFKSPDARKIFEALKVSSTSPNTETVSRHVIPITVDHMQGREPSHCSICFPQIYHYNYFNGLFPQSAEFRAVVYNTEQGGWPLRAKSGTSLQIRDLYSRGIYGTNWVTPSDGTRVGRGYRPYVYVKHVTSNNGGSRTRKHVEKFGYKWKVEASGGRNGGWKTLSNHFINFRDPSSTAGQPLIRILTVDRFDNQLGDL